MFQRRTPSLGEFCDVVSGTQGRIDRMIVYWALPLSRLQLMACKDGTAVHLYISNFVILTLYIATVIGARLLAAQSCSYYINVP